MNQEAIAVARLSAAVVAKALAEPEFRAQLVEDPKSTVEKVLGTALPAGLRLKVREATPSEYTIVLPHQPQAAADGELSDADLETVAGGAKANSAAFHASVEQAGDGLASLFDMALGAANAQARSGSR